MSTDRVRRDRAGRVYPRAIRSEQDPGRRGDCWSVVVVCLDAAGYVVAHERRYYRRAEDARAALWDDIPGSRGRILHPVTLRAAESREDTGAHRSADRG